MDPKLEQEINEFVEASFTVADAADAANALRYLLRDDFRDDDHDWIGPAVWSISIEFETEPTPADRLADWFAAVVARGQAGAARLVARWRGWRNG